MKIFDDISQCSLSPCVATIGFFDGVHCGHRYLIQQVKEIADKTGLKSLIVTFKKHPREVLSQDYKPCMLTTYEERMELLSKCDVDYCFPLHFTREFSLMKASDFMKTFLKEKLNVKVLVMGYDHHFGSDRLSFEEYQQLGQTLGIEVAKAKEFINQPQQNISSSAIRSCIQNGEMEQASSMLGYFYFLKGKVVGGQHLGRKLGFPTANVSLKNIDKIVPLDGAYAVKVEIEGTSYIGMANLGNRPTVDDNGASVLEIHILNFSQDIYDKEIKVEFCKRIRPEKRFSSLQELTLALQKDLQKVEEFFAK